MKLYITDLDGTFLDNRAAVPKLSEQLSNILINQGVCFTYATARSIYSAMPLVKSVEFNLPVITYNGAIIVNPETMKPIVSHCFEREMSEKIRDFFSDKKDSLLIYAYIDGKERVSYLETNQNKGVKRYVAGHSEDVRMRKCESYDELFAGELYYITIITPVTDKEVLDEFFCSENGFTANYQEDTYEKGEYWYEVFHKDASKANAVTALKNMLDAEEVICFGDNYNDISMLKAADRGYAVSNAAEEVKTAASGIIRSNFQSGVPLFIYQDNIVQRAKPVFDTNPDNEKFKRCIELSRTEINEYGIGTLNEKQTHAVLKKYFSDTDYDREVKIGKYYADIVTENGIIEIQTQGFKALLSKLQAFLEYCPVTVVYPYKKKTRLSYFDKKSGELIKQGRTVTHNCLTDFFTELYRIKPYLNHPNLTICIADISVEQYRFCGKDLKRRKTDIKQTAPVELLGLEFFYSADDYKQFIPKGLNETFTKKEFSRLCDFSDTAIVLSILRFMGLIDFDGKSGNEIVYRITDKKIVE